MVSAREKLKAVRAALCPVSGEDAAFEAGEMLREYAGISPRLCGEAQLSEEAERLIDEAVRRRQAGEPLQYIFGQWEFYGLPFYCGSGVLIPRPETELLAEIAINEMKRGGKGGKCMLDLFSGTGCVPIAASICAKADNAEYYAVELYAGAFSYLERNIALNGAPVTAVNGDALDETLLGGRTFDVITANPPYLDSGEMAKLQKEVRFEPATALYGGEDGLMFYRKFIPIWVRRLRRGGLFAVETGEKQGAAVSAVMHKAGLTAEIIKDHGGNDRVVVGRMAEDG